MFTNNEKNKLTVSQIQNKTAFINTEPTDIAIIQQNLVKYKTQFISSKLREDNLTTT